MTGPQHWHTLRACCIDHVLERACWCCGCTRYVMREMDGRWAMECDDPYVRPACPLYKTPECKGMNHPVCPHFADFLELHSRYASIFSDAFVDIVESERRSPSAP